MDNQEVRKKLIVGLGNPGEEYEGTRHNVGFSILESYAKKNGATLVREKAFPGYFAKFRLKNYEVLLLLPLTYMNVSGSAIRRCVDFYKIPLEGLLVIVDDMDLPFKTLRLRSKGRSGGHNGLKSVEERMGTTAYSRLKVGVGHPGYGNVVDHVLGAFSQEERQEIPRIIQAAEEMIGAWLEEPTLALSKELEENKTNP